MKLSFEDYHILKLRRKDVEAEIRNISRMQHKLKYGRKFGVKRVNPPKGDPYDVRDYVGMREDHASLHRLLRLRCVRGPKLVARHLNLLWGFFRGRSYPEIEQNARTVPRVAILVQMMGRYGPPELKNSTREARKATIERWLLNEANH